MNCNTQNAKIKSITEKTLIVGIDVGSETHYARAFDWRNIEFSKKPFAFSNDEAGFASFKAWLEDIKEKFGKTIVLPGMEPTGHYWFNLGAFLQDNGMKPVHVNPHHVHKSKELDDNNPSKDPKTIAALVNEGRFNYPYIPTGVYAEIRSLYGLQVMTQEALIRVKNRIARWLSIYFPEYKDVYRSCDAISGVMVLKVCPLPADIVMLGADGVNKIWRDAKLRAAGMKRARPLVEAAKHSVGSTESPEAAKYEMELLLGDYEVYTKRLEELTEKIEVKLEEIPYVDKLLEIKGVGKKTVSGLIAEIGDISRFDNPKQIQKLAGYAIVACSSGKHKGESHISYRGRKKSTINSFSSDTNIWEVGSATGAYGSYKALKLAVPDGKLWTVKVSADGYKDLTVKITKETVNYTDTYKAEVVSNSGETTNKTYTADVTPAVNGKITLSAAKDIKEGDTVTVTATPDENYEVVAVTVKGVSGKSVDVQNAEGIYTFKMPAENVTVSATFKEKAIAGNKKIEVSQVSINKDLWGSDWEFTFKNAEDYVSAITDVKVNGTSWEEKSYSVSSGGQYYKNTSSNKLVCAAREYSANPTIPVLKSGDIAGVAVRKRK